MPQNVKCHREAKHDTTLKVLFLFKDLKRSHELKTDESVRAKYWSVTSMDDVIHRNRFGYTLNKVYRFT